MTAPVALVMGSDSDFPKVEPTIQALAELGVPCDVMVMSAHRSPDRVTEFARRASEKGTEIIIAAAGGAAHLAGVIAAHTTLPVIGIPIRTEALGGVDSLYSTVQMPSGVPVACVAIGTGGAINAGLFAAQILALNDPELRDRLVAKKRELEEKVAEKDRRIRKKLEDMGG